MKFFNEWNELNSQEDVRQLMETFGYFHDSCLKEMHLWTGHYVRPDLSMVLSGELDTKVRFLIHRQDSNPSAIELIFEEVTGLVIVPSPENYDSLIFEATFLLLDGIFYWADDIDWLPNDPTKYRVNWVSSRKVKWRDASKWMGAKMRYGPK